jgi:hypothetical protein
MVASLYRVKQDLSELKLSESLATCYDKTVSRFLGFALISAIKLWLRCFGDSTEYGITSRHCALAWTDEDGMED